MGSLLEAQEIGRALLYADGVVVSLMAVGLVLVGVIIEQMKCI